MRATLLWLTAGLLVAVSSAAMATDDTTVVSQGAAPPPVVTTPAPISYSADDGKVTCHHMVHEGMVTSVVQCHTQAGWDRLRMLTQQRIMELQDMAHRRSPY